MLNLYIFKEKVLFIRANKSIETINSEATRTSKQSRNEEKINQISMQNETWSNLINAEHQQSIKRTKKERKNNKPKKKKKKTSGTERKERSKNNIKSSHLQQAARRAVYIKRKTNCHNHKHTRSRKQAT